MRTLYLGLLDTLIDARTEAPRAALAGSALEAALKRAGVEAVGLVIDVPPDAGDPVRDPRVGRAVRALFSDAAWFRATFKGVLTPAALAKRLADGDAEWAYIDHRATRHAGDPSVLNDARVFIPDPAADGRDILAWLESLSQAWAPTVGAQSPAPPSAMPASPAIASTFEPAAADGTLLEFASAADEQPVTITAPPGSGATTVPTGQSRDTFTGKYNIAKVLGRGGMGEVSVATDQPLRREVAIKTLLRGDDGMARMRFVAEAQITGQLEHPNIVPVHELGTDANGCPYLAMKLVKGAALADVLDQIANGQLDALDRIGSPGSRAAKQRARAQRMGAAPAANARPADVLNRLLEVFTKICDAVSYAHARHVVHRDLKPENIMVGAFGEVLVMDWGLAKVLTSEPTASGSAGIASDRDEAIAKGADHVRTMDGAIAGTPMYMPPEQAEGRIDDIDARSDVYALGAVLYEMVGLVKPFTGESVYTLLGKIARGVIEPLRARSAAPWDVSPALEAIILKAMHLSPGRRYQSAAALKADIEAWLTYRPVSAHPDSPLTKVTKWVRRHPTTSMSGVVGGLALALLSLSIGIGVAQTEASNARAEKLDRERAEQKAGRAEAEAQASSAKFEAERQAHLTMLLEGRVDDLLVELGGHRKDVVHDDVLAFRDLWERVQPMRPTDPEFTEAIGDRLPMFLRGFAELMLFAERYPGYVTLTAQDYFHHAMLLAASGDMRAACEAFDRALALEDDHELARFNRGNARKLLGDTEGAAKDYTACIELAGETRAASLRLRGDLRVDLRDLLGARRDLDAALEATPDDATVRISRGKLFEAVGELDAAGREFDAALRLDSEAALAWHGKGVVCARQGNWRAAITAYSEAIARDPDLAEALDNRGFANLRLGQLNQALADHSAAVAADPSYVRAYNNRGIVHLRLRDTPKAIDDFSLAIELDPTMTEPYVNRGMQLRAQGELVLARADFDKAIELGFDAAIVYAERAAISIAEQDMVAAAVDLEKAVERDPSSWQRWNNLAAAKQSSDLQRAAYAMQQAYRRCPDPAIRAEFANALRAWGAEVPD